MAAHVSVSMYQRSLSQRYRLVGNRCKACGKVSFTPKGVCQYCRKSRDFIEVPLGGKGTVYSFTLIASGGAPPEFSAEATVNGAYPVVLIELDEGPKIVSQLADKNVERLKIGSRVEALIRRIYVEEDVVRYGYRFRLLSESE